MRKFVMALVLMLPAAASAKDRAAFLEGQYATKEQCEKLRKIEAGTPRNVETAPELLDANGFHSWEGACEFTKVFEHDPGKSWVGLMVCSEGNTIAPEMYVFAKVEGQDSFEVGHADDDNGPEEYTRCDSKEGKKQ